MIELQTQVQQLLDMVQRLQSTLDSRFGVLQSLAQQTADNATQMTATVNALQQKINAQNDASSGKLDTVSGQVQSLNDSVDELKSRVTKLDKSIAEHPDAAGSGAGYSSERGWFEWDRAECTTRRWIPGCPCWAHADRTCTGGS